jgi:hypothetical protein
MYVYAVSSPAPDVAVTFFWLIQVPFFLISSK